MEYAEGGREYGLAVFEFALGAWSRRGIFY
jgi:hypothetical protein